MKTGIIGLPQVGKTSLFKILTKAKLEDRGYSREAHIGVARVPDERLDKLSAMDDATAAEFLSSYGLHDSGLVRLIRKSYQLLGLISFFNAGQDECRPWTVPLGSRPPQAAGAIHSDLEHHFIRAETIRWDALLEAGSEAAARARGTLRLEGKEYVVHDGDVLHMRHSG